MKFSKIWWILLIPLIPIALNYLLPLGNYSNIGGKDSLTVWLNFWATFSNTLIFCLITCFVLYKQIQNDANQNTQNRELTLNTIKYNARLSQISNLIPVCSEYIALYDIDAISIMEKEWSRHKRTNEYCHDYLKKRIEETKNIWFKFNLALKSCEDIEEEFIERQKNHYNQLLSFLSLMNKYFNLDPYDFHDETGRKKIIDKLNKSCSDFTFHFTLESNPFHTIQVEFSDICLHNIQSEIELFITKYRQKAANILNGKNENAES